MNSAGQNEHSTSHVRRLVGKSSSEHTQQDIPLCVRERSSRTPPPRIRPEGVQPAGSSGACSADPTPLGTVGIRGVGDAALLPASGSAGPRLYSSLKDGANKAPTQPSARKTASSTTVGSDQRDRPRQIVAKQEEFDLASVLFSPPEAAVTPSSVRKRNKQGKRPPDRSQSSHEIRERPCEITKTERNSKKVTFKKEIVEIRAVVDNHTVNRTSPAAGVNKSARSPEDILTTRNSQIDEFRKPSWDIAHECSPESLEKGETATPAEPRDGVDTITTVCQGSLEQLDDDLCGGDKQHDDTGRLFTFDGQGPNSTDDAASDTQVHLNEHVETAMLRSDKVTSEQHHQKLWDRGAEIDDRTTGTDTVTMSKITASVVIEDGERDKNVTLSHSNHDTPVGMATDADGHRENSSADLQMERCRGNPPMISRSAETAVQATLNNSYHRSTVGMRTDEDGLREGRLSIDGDEAKCNDDQALITGVTGKHVSTDATSSCDYKDSAIAVDGATCSHTKDTASHDQDDDRDLITDQTLRWAHQSDCVETVADVKPSEVLGTLSQVDAPEEKTLKAVDTGINSPADKTLKSKPSDRENILPPDGSFQSENAKKPENDGPTSQGISPPNIEDVSEGMTSAAESPSVVTGQSTICINGESALSVSSPAKSSPECDIRQSFSSTMTGCPLMGSLAAASSELLGSTCDGENGGHKLVEKLLTPKITAVTSLNRNTTAMSPKSPAEILTTYCTYSSAHSVSTSQYVATGVATDRLLSPSYFQRSKVHSAQSSGISPYPANTQSLTSSVPPPRTISAPASVSKAFIEGKPQVLFLPGNRQAVLPQQGSLGPIVWSTSTAACAQSTPQQLAHQAEFRGTRQQTQTTPTTHCQPTVISSYHQALPSRNAPGVMGHQVTFPGGQGRYQVIRFQQPSAVVPCNVQPIHYVIYKDTVTAGSASSKPQPPSAPPILHAPVTHRVPQPVATALPGHRFHLVSHPLPRDPPPPPPPVLSTQAPNDRSSPPPPPPPGTPKQSPHVRTIQYQAPFKAASPRMQSSFTRSNRKPVPASVIPNGTLFVQTSKGLVKLQQQLKVNQATSVTSSSHQHKLLPNRTEGKTSALVIQNQSNSSVKLPFRPTKDLPSRPGRSQTQLPVSKALTLHMKPGQTTGIRLPFQMLSQKQLLYLTSKNASQQLEKAQNITVHPGLEKSGTQRGAEEVTDSKSSENSFEGNQQPDGYNKRSTERSVEVPETKSVESTTETCDKGFAKRIIRANISVEGVKERSENVTSKDDAGTNISLPSWKMSKIDMDSESTLSDSDMREPSEIISLHSSSDESQSDETASSHKEDYTEIKTTSDDDDIKDEWRPSVPVKIPSKCTRRFRNPFTGGLSKINIRTSARRSSGGKGSSAKKGRRSTKVNNGYHGDASKTKPCCKMDAVKGRKDSRQQPTCTRDALSAEATKKADLALKSKSETSDDDKHTNNIGVTTNISTELACQMVDGDDSSLSSRPTSASSFEDNVPHKTMAHQKQLDSSSIKNVKPVKKGSLLEDFAAQLHITRELSGNRTSSPSKRYHLRTTPSRNSDSDTLSSKYPKRVSSDDMNSDGPATTENSTRECVPLRQAGRNLGRMQDGQNPSNHAPLWQQVLKMLGLRRKKPVRPTPPSGTPWHKRRSSSVVLAESLAESAKRLERIKEATNDIESKKHSDKSGSSAAMIKAKETSQTSKNEKQSIKDKDSGGTSGSKKKGKKAGKKAAKKQHKRRKLAKKANVSPQSLSDPTSGSLTSIDFDSRRQTRSRIRPKREPYSVSSSQIDSASPSSIRRGRKTLASISAQTWEDCYRCTYLKWKETKISPDNLAVDEGFKVMTNELGTPRAGPSKDKMSFQKLLMSKWEDIVQSAQTGSLGESGSETHERESPVNTRGFAFVETPPVAAEFSVCTTDHVDPSPQEVQNNFPCMSGASDRNVDTDFIMSGNGMEEAQDVQITDNTRARNFTDAPEQEVLIDSYGKPPALSPIQDLPIEPIDHTGRSAERIDTIEAAKASGFLIPKMLTEDTLRLLAESGNIDSDLSGVQAFALFMPGTRENSCGDPVLSSPSPQPISLGNDDDNIEVPPVISCHRLNNLHDDGDDEAGEIDVEVHKENQCQPEPFYTSLVPSAKGSDKIGFMHEMDKSLKSHLPVQTGQEQNALCETNIMLVSQDDSCLATDVMPSATSHQDMKDEDEELRCTVLQKPDSSTASLEEGEIIDE